MVFGALQMVGGAKLTVAGVVAVNPLAAGGGLALAVNGADDFWAGAFGIWTGGEYQETLKYAFGHWAATSLGASAETARYIGIGTEIGIGVLTGIAAAKGAASLEKAATRAVAEKADNVRFIAGVDGTTVDAKMGGLSGRVTTSGAVLEAESGRTTTVIGSFADDMRSLLSHSGNLKTSAIGQSRPGGFNLLNVADEIYKRNPGAFFERYNRPWLEAAIERGDRIVFATRPLWGTGGNLVRRGKDGFTLTGFGREYSVLRKHGYVYDPVSNAAVHMR
jgi:hypothetical protein